MSLSPDRRIPPPVQVPTYRFNEERAKLAYAAHIALIDQEQRIPELRENPYWQIARADVYEAFVAAFGGQG